MQKCISKSPSYTLAKEKRIRKRREYLRVQRCGIRSFGRFVVAVAQREKEGTLGKIGITVPKKVGAAHIRNKIKRRLRHILRVNQSVFFEKALVVVARDCANLASFAELETDLIDVCRRLRMNRVFDLSRQKNNARKVA